MSLLHFSKIFSGEPSGSSPPADYTPFFTWTTEGRSNGASLDGNGWVDGINATYSNDITGPHGESLVGKFICETRAQQSNPDGSFFGGTIASGSVVTDAAIGSGDHLWFRMYHYFPSGFCHSYAPGGDGWGRCKWFRFDWPGGDPPPRTYVDISQISGGCGTTSNIRGGGTEQITPCYLSEDDAPANNLINGSWLAVQVHIYFNSAATGYAEFWVGTTYQGREILRLNSDDSPTTVWANAPGSGVMQAMILGDYWNAGPTKQETLYLADCIATTETPTTLDSGGRPYISPSAKASDFA